MQRTGFLVPAVTAFCSRDGELDERGNRAIYKSFVDNGLDGAVIMGSTGEFFSMDTAGKKRLIDLAADSLLGKLRFLVGTSCMRCADTIELGNYAIDAGAEAVMVITPYYFSLSDESIEHYYDLVADGIRGNLFLYNFPVRTGYDLKPEAAYRLIRRHPNIVGYKDTVSDAGHTRDLIQMVKGEFPDFEIYSGNDDCFAHTIASGGNGSIGALANLVPEVIADWVRAVREKDADGIAEGQKKVDRLMELYQVGTPFIPALKRAMQMRGFPMDDVCTTPFLRVSDNQDARIRRILENAGVLDQGGGLDAGA